MPVPGERRVIASGDLLESFVNPTNATIYSGQSTHNNESTSIHDISNNSNTEIVYAYLRQIRRTSDTTKFKSLVALTTFISTEDRQNWLVTVPAIIKGVLFLCLHKDSGIRSHAFSLLRTTLIAGKDVKMAAVSSLKELSGPWILAMNDMHREVRLEACKAFEEVFPSDKRSTFLLNYKENILSYIDGVLKDNLTNENEKVVIKEELSDLRANMIYSSIRSLGYMVKQVSSAQTAVLTFVLESPLFNLLLPIRDPKKSSSSSTGSIDSIAGGNNSPVGTVNTNKSKKVHKNEHSVYIASKAPLVRSSTLALLRDIVTVCPLTPKLHQRIAKGLSGSMKDDHLTVATRVWELLLFWCRANCADAITHFEPHFLDDVVDSFMQCHDVALGEVIFPSIIPLLAQLSKDPRCEGVLDEFCGALIEKIKKVSITPNVSADELEFILSALMGSWEIHCLRRKGTSSASESEDLFYLILLNITTLMEPCSRRQRYREVVVKSVSNSLLKTAVRHEGYFKNCMAVLRLPPEENPKVLPKDVSTPSLVECFDWLQSRIIGAMFRVATKDRTYTRQIPMLQRELDIYLSTLVESNRFDSIHSFLKETEDTYPLTSPQAELIVDHLIQLLNEESTDVSSASQPPREKAEVIPKKVSTVEFTSSQAPHYYRDELVKLVLRNTPDTAIVNRLIETSKRSGITEVADAIQEHLIRDPKSLLGVLLEACEDSRLDDMDRCFQQANSMTYVWTDSNRRDLFSAVERGLQNALDLVITEGKVNAFASKEVDIILPNSEFSSPASVGSTFSPVTAKEGTLFNSTTDFNSKTNNNDKNANNNPVASRVDADKDEPDELGDKEGTSSEVNEGPELMYRIVAWCTALSHGSALANALNIQKGQFPTEFLDLLFSCVAAVAPKLHPEQYVSIKALRIVLEKFSPESSTETATDTDDETDAEEKSEEAEEKSEKEELQEEEEASTGDMPKELADPLSEAIEKKTHALTADHFSMVTEHVQNLLSSWDVSTDVIDKFAENYLRGVICSSVEASKSIYVSQQLHHLIPFASSAFWQNWVMNPVFWSFFDIPVLLSENTEESKANVNESGADAGQKKSSENALTTAQDIAIPTPDSMHFFEGYFSLFQLDLTLTKAVRRAQALRLMDFCDASSVLDAPTCLYLLLHSAAVKEIFIPAIGSLLFTKLFPRLFARLTTAEESRKVAHLLLENSDKWYLIVTLAASFLEVAKRADSSQHEELVSCARLLVSALTEDVIGHLYTSTGARGISGNLVFIFSTFFDIMDQTADVVHDNMLSTISAEKERMIKEAICCIPDFDANTGKLTIIIHRHLSSCPVVADSTVKFIVEFAQKKTPLVGLELLVELASARILNATLYSDLIRAIVNLMCRCYTLVHLPSNGRLQSQTPEAPSRRLHFDELRRIAVAAVLARRGVVIHNRMDSVLRSSVNSIVFDAVCECVSRLRHTNSTEMPLLTKLVAFTTAFTNELTPSDVSVVRASELSAQKIGTVFSFMYQWLCLTPIGTLEGIGMETVAQVLRSVNNLTCLTLLRSPFSLDSSILVVIERCMLKPLRDEFSSSEQAKLSLFRRQNALLHKTQKQKMILFPYLLAWAVYLTTPGNPAEREQRSISKEFRKDIFKLLDLLCSILLTPVCKKSRSIGETFLGTITQEESVGPYFSALDGSPEAQDGSLFDIYSLTQCDSDEPMLRLAQGATTLFSLLLEGRMFVLVKEWLETTERKIQALFHKLVEQHISPRLLRESLNAVLDHNPTPGEQSFVWKETTTVQVSLPQRCVLLTYEMEDAKVSLRISFPMNYPLSPPTVDAGTRDKRNGVKSDTLRIWMLKMTVLLFGGCAKVWECVELFEKNLSMHFSGHEPCPICFAVVHSVNQRLPDMRCSVCRNSAIHAACLYTWWSTGGQNVCPLCRSPWVSE